MTDNKATNDETAGRLRREFAAYYAGMKIIPNQSEWLMADAIDRLAADVAVIKAKVEQIAPEDVRHFVESEKAWVRLVEEQRDAAVRERNEARAKVERLQAELHTEIHGHMASRVEIERLCAEPAAPQPAAPPPGWLTEKERRVLCELLDVRWGDAFERVPAALRSILARAGSPPVVEVPLFENYAPEVLHLRYRDAISRAGVAWKEVGRE